MDTLALTLVTGLALALRLIRVTTPRGLFFDEPYYASEACSLAGATGTPCIPNAIPEHPPLGKLLISLGIRAFGFNPLGWRIAAVVTGTLTVTLLYVLTRKLLGSALGATVASGLLAIDFLHFVQSRLAMLDVFVVFFGVAAFLFAVMDRDALLAGRSALRTASVAARVLGRPWRLAAGAAAGAAAASKWSGWLFLAGLLVLTIAWESSTRRGTGRHENDRREAFGRMLREEAPSMLVGLAIVPLLVYVASFIGSIHGPFLAVPWSRGSWVREFMGRQRFSLLYHLRLGRSHPYTSPGWSWLLLKRPIAYQFKILPSGRYQEVLALGSPLVWWAGILALAAVAAGWLRKRDPAGPEGLILAGFAWSYLPWLAAGSTRSTSFLFYLLPAVPFLSIALAYTATLMARSLAGKAAFALFSSAAVLLFAFYYPVLAAVPLSPSSWDRRILFDDCRGTTAMARVALGGRTRLVPDLTRGGNPPVGWCWV